MDAWLSIRQVAEQTGIPAATLRAWERRYQFPVPDRTAGGHRRYSATDVEALRRAHTLVEQGWSAGAAVRQVSEASQEPSMGGAPAGTTGVATDDHGDVAAQVDVSSSPVATRTRTDVPADAPGTAGVDVELLVLLTRALRGMLRANSPARVALVLHDAVASLGADLVTADLAGPDALPIDVSLGLSEPLLPVAEPYTLARMRLEAMLPGLVEDAQSAVDRLRALPRS